MTDVTEDLRRDLISCQQEAVRRLGGEEILKAVREQNPDACDTNELGEQYDVVGFMAPFVSVIRKKDGVKGTMEFLHQPRIYYGFKAE